MACEPRQILIIGGTSGIGAAIARAFALSGLDRVLVTGRSEAEVHRFREQHRDIEAMPLDLLESAAVPRLVDSLPKLDVLVNCAGIILRNGQEHEPDGFRQVIEVNLLGMARVAQACHKLLGESQGCVVNVASMLSFFGSGFAPAYSASKGGVLQLTRSLAIAWAPRVRVNAIAPGWIETDLTRALIEDPDRNRQILQRTPLARWGQPEDVAGPVLFLCSPEARFVTGAVLTVDGGYSIA